MTSARRTLTIVFAGDAAQLDRTASRVSSTAGQIGKSGEQAQSRWKTAMSRMGPAVKAGLAIGGAALVAFAKGSVDAYMEAEEGQAKFLAQVKRIPGISAPAIKAFEDQASALALKTKFDDDATKAAQGQLATFGLTAGQITKLTPLVQDYATKTGKDLTTAATDLGRAMNGQTRGLKAVGVNYKSTGDKGKDFENITAALQGKVGGLAETAGGTAAGKVAILKNQFGEIQEAVGQKLVPILTTLGGWLLKIVDFVGKNIQWLGPLAAAIGAVAAVTKIWSGIQAVLNVVMAANPITLIILGIVALVAAIVLAYNRFAWFRNIVQVVWNAIKTYVMVNVNIIKAVIAGIMVVVRAVVAVFRWMLSIVRSVWSAHAAVIRAVVGVIRAVINGLMAFFRNIPGWVRTALSKVGSVISAPFRAGWDWVKRNVISPIGGAFGRIPGAITSALKTVWNAITTPFKTAWDWVKKHVIDPVESAFGVIGRGVDSIKKAYNSFARTWNGIEVKVGGWDPPGPGPKIPGFTLGLPDLPLFKLAQGGYIDRATFAMIGEGRDSEIVSPVPMLHQIMRDELAAAAGSTNVTLHLNLDLGADTITRTVQFEIDRSDRTLIRNLRARAV